MIHWEKQISNSDDEQNYFTSNPDDEDNQDSEEDPQEGYN